MRAFSYHKKLMRYKQEASEFKRSFVDEIDGNTNDEIRKNIDEFIEKCNSELLQGNPNLKINYSLKCEALKDIVELLKIDVEVP